MPCCRAGRLNRVSSSRFQFSIGDAVRRLVAKVSALGKEVSILYWRCYEGFAEIVIL